MLKRWWLSVFCLTLLFLSCAKEKVEERAIPAQEQSQTQVVVDYGRLAERIERLEQAVREQSTAVEPRLQLLAACLDSTRRVLHVSGRGKPSSTATSEPTALQAAERAAVIDAYRWVAYLLRWNENPRTPDFGTIEGGIPGGFVVYKQTLPGNEILVLLEVALPKP